jgi:vancomycin permeability regulator SanA
VFRLARRSVLLVVLVVAVYLAVTFVQVWSASRRDEAGAGHGRRSPPDQAIVVLGAAQYNGRPSPVLRARLDHAADLYGRRVAPTIVVTGGQTVNDPTRFTEASASADYLARSRGVPQSAILRENAGCNTWQSLASTANELRKRGQGRVILVSDPFHSARVAAIAAELHLDARVSPTRTSPISGATELRHLARESAIVAAGRIVGFRRLMGVNELARPSAAACA